ncbi:MAG: hypothetical protein LCH69_01720 [Proteobacteria bacterium]|nr:hypothetical protein [Pseudomonadota bacterium]
MKALVRNPIAWGITLSGLVLLLVLGLACVRDDTGTTGYARFLTLEPNAMGDTLAGIFASLAFIWIVVTVFIQSAELREQRKVLKAQRFEFEQMAAAQKAQVDALRAQAEIFLDEQKDRHERRAEKLFLAQLESVKNKMLEIAKPGEFWLYERDGRVSSFRIGDNQYESRLRLLAGRDMIDSIFNELRAALETLKILNNKGELRAFPGKKILEALEERIIDLQQADGLSEATRIVLYDYGLERIESAIDEILSISSRLPEQSP